MSAFDAISETDPYKIVPASNSPLRSLERGIEQMTVLIAEVRFFCQLCHSSNIADGFHRNLIDHASLTVLVSVNYEPFQRPPRISYPRRSRISLEFWSSSCSNELDWQIQ